MVQDLRVGGDAQGQVEKRRSLRYLSCVYGAYESRVEPCVPLTRLVQGFGLLGIVL